MRFGFIIGLLLCAGLITADAAAQRVVVAAQALSATQQAARLYGHSIELGAPGLLPGAQAFPGPVPLGPLASWPDSRWALLSTETLLGDSTIAVQLAPFNLRPDLRRDAAPGVRERLDQTTIIDGQPHAVFLGREENGVGHVAIAPFDADAPGGFLPDRLRWTLEGTPVSTAILGEPPRLHVLVRSEIGPVVHSGPLSETESATATHRLEGLEGAAGLAPGKLAVSTDGRLWATIHGFSFSRASGAPTTWLYTLAPDNGKVVAPPLALPGTQPDGASLYPLSGDCAWVATEARGPGFYYLTKVCFVPGGLEKTAEYPLRIGKGGLRIAIHPGSGYVAVASGQRIEMWPNGERENRSRVFADGVESLRWHGDMLLAAEGNRVHRLDLFSLESMYEQAVPGGLIARLLPVPRQFAANDADGDGLTTAQEADAVLNPFNPDTDGDGIHDGRDPEPGKPSPELSLPDAVLFRGDAAGHELRTVQIDPGIEGRLGWQVDPESGVLPWLRVYPNNSAGKGLLHLGVDPELFDGTEKRAALLIALEGVSRGAEAAGSPSRLRIGVQPARGGTRRVLWIWKTPGENIRDRSDPRGFAVLAERLAAAPFYFAHEETHAAQTYALSDYGLVVLSAEAAAQGSLPPGEIMEYIAAGGALLLLGTQADGDGGAIQRLLAPMGFGVATEGAAGSAVMLPESPLGLKGIELRFASGRAIAAPPEYVSASITGDEEGMVVVRDYGLGRIAAIAAPTPLLSRALSMPANQRFADALFRWLARAGTRITDDDGDGLSDAIETEHNTNLALPDTDGDGVPDGMEDRNRNGLVDEGETDPRNTDSDGDGILDGADPRPYPALGAPRILALSITESPLEGGREIVLSGRHLANDAQYHIGERPATLIDTDGFATARLRVPEASAIGPATVHVSTVTGDGALADVFAYTPRSQVLLRLEPLPELRPIIRDEIYEGILVLNIEPDESASPNRMLLRLQTLDAPGFRFTGTRPAPDLARRGIEVIGRDREDEGYEVLVNPVGSGTLAPGAAVWLTWEQARDTWNGEAIRIEAVAHPDRGAPIMIVLGPHGGILEARLSASPFMPDGTAVPRVPPTKQDSP